MIEVADVSTAPAATSGSSRVRIDGIWANRFERTFRNMRIRNKALLIFIIAGLIPLIITNTFAYAQAESNIQSTIERQVARFAQGTRDHLGELFGNLEAVDSSLALDETVFGAFDIRAGDLVMGTNTWTTIALPDLDLLLPEVASQFDSLSLIFLADAHYICVYTSGNKTMNLALEGYNLTSDTAIGKALNSSLAGVQTWSQLTYFAPLKSNVLVLSTPVRASGRVGNVIGTVNLVVSQEYLDGLLLENIEILGQTADSYCITSDGTLLTDMRHGQYSSQSALRVRLNDETVRELAGPIETDQLNFSKMIEYKDEGVTILAYVSVIQFANAAAGLVTRLNADEAFAQITFLRNILIVAVACVACLGSIVSVRFAEMLSNPANRLLHIVEEMARGNTALRPDVEGKDEIGLLAEGIGEVVDNYGHMIGALTDANAKLAQAERLAAVGETAAMVGHDLRNPLQGISGATHILRNNSLTAGERIQMLQLIDDCVKYSDGIVKNLLDYSREIRLELANVSIKQVVKDALLAVNVPKKVGVLDQSEAQLMLIADPNALKRVFVNLIDNAVDAMPEGGRITITSEEQKDFVKISVSDTGVGLSKQAMENLWKPLRTTKAKGMGIGLAICKRLVEAHGGKIAVESREGSGTTFTIRIPIK